ncbi:MAG: M56 family metallopeptidase [Bacteroidia bacterium]
MSLEIALKVITTLLLFYSYYIIALKSTTWHLAKRVYLLLASCSMFLPLLSISEQVPVITYTLPNILIENPEETQNLVKPWITVQGVYQVGVLVLTILFFARLFSVVRLLSTSKKITSSIREIASSQSPCSFLKWTFIPKNLEGEVRQQVLAHEQAHINQGHSIDVIFLELLTIFFWFNPFVYLVKRELKMVHEYEADLIAKNHVQSYSKGLLLFARWKSSLQLTSAINPSFQQLKNRIEMLHKTPTKIIRKVLFAGILPIIFSSLIIVACSESASLQPSDSVEPETVVDVAEVMPEFDGGMDALVTYLRDNVKYPEQEKIDGIEENIIVQFTIKSNGAVDDVNVLKGENDNLKAAAVKAIESMPNWKPGMNNDEPVAVKYTIPVNFKLQ